MFAIPNYNSIAQQNLSLHCCKKLQQSLQYARLLAIKHNTFVIIAPSNNNAWSNGFSITQGAQVIKTYPATKNLDITWHGFAGKQYSITVLPNGMTHNNGHFSICAKNNTKNMYKLILNKTMQTKIVMPAGQ